MTIILSKKNTKIGNIVSFSIPSVTTCPGRTAWCEKKCYAKRMEARYKNVKLSYEKNYECAQSPKFVTEMNEALANQKSKTVRIHVSGDFYSIAYINKWIKIIQSNPTLQFYTYTKSWRIPRLKAAILRLSKLPNLVIFASTDIDTFNNEETAPPTLREAYSGDNQPSKTVLCPVQAGKCPDCFTCKLCIKSTITTSIYFKTH